MAFLFIFINSSPTEHCCHRANAGEFRSVSSVARVLKLDSIWFANFQLLSKVRFMSTRLYPGVSVGYPGYGFMSGVGDVWQLLART